MLGYVVAYMFGQSDGKASCKKDEECMNNRTKFRKNKLFEINPVTNSDNKMALPYRVLILSMLLIAAFSTVSSFFSVDTSSFLEMIRISR